jgi:predicted dehydrogenase
MSAIRLGVVGGGPRAAFFLKQAAAMTDRIEVVGMTSRTAETREKTAAAFGIPTFDSVESLIAQRPDFVLIAVAWAAAPDIVHAVVGAGIPVLVETPPAPDADGLRALWADVGSTGLVQVAEHSMYTPSHAAKLAAVRDGVIGTPTAVQVSSNHGYHAVAIMRAFLEVGFDPVTVRASTFKAPVVHPVLYDQWQADLTPRPARTTIATLDFGSSMGLYDFTDLQWFSPIRHRRLVVRGETGEIDGDSVLRLRDGAAVPSMFIRRYLGVDMNHEGFDLDHISLDGEIRYRNPNIGLRRSDEDIAAAGLLDAMSEWIAGDGPEPYPLAEGCQDHLLFLAIEEAARTREAVTTSFESWGQ